MIIAHNTWTAVNYNGFNNFVTLIESSDYKDVYTYTGRVTLDNIFKNEFLILIFQLEYISNFNEFFFAIILSETSFKKAKGIRTIYNSWVETSNYQ